jgi:hypothetical protein
VMLKYIANKQLPLDFLIPFSLVGAA